MGIASTVAVLVRVVGTKVRTDTGDDGPSPDGYRHVLPQLLPVTVHGTVSLQQ